MKKTIWLWGIHSSHNLGQTSNFSWDEPNSNLGRPTLSKDRLLGQTSNLGRVEPINWIRPKRYYNNFPPNKVKYRLRQEPIKFDGLLITIQIFSWVRRMWRSTFVPETIFRRFIRLKQTERTRWTIQTHSDELNWARRHERNSLSLTRWAYLARSVSPTLSARKDFVLSFKKNYFSSKIVRSVTIAEYWLRFLGQYPAILTFRLVNREL